MHFDTFFKKQLHNLKEEKILFFLKIFKILLKLIILIPLKYFFAIIFSVVFYIPFSVYKLNFLEIDTSRIGHFAGSIESHIKIINEAVNSKKKLLLFKKKPIANSFLLKAFEEHLKKNYSNIKFIPGNSFWIAVANIFKLIFKIEIIIYRDWDKDYNEFYNKKLFNLSTNYQIEGQKLLKDLGVPKNSKIICVHNRDSLYLKKHYKNIMDASHHDYRDFSLKNMIPALDFFTKSGFYVVRFGSDNFEKLCDYTNNSMIIDYVNHPLRSDFGDIYLNSVCEFYFGSDSGAWNISRLFRKPGFLINSCPLYSMFCMRWDFPGLIKKIYDIKNKKILSISEIVKLNLINLDDSKKIDKKGFKYLENTPEEILNLAKEAIQITKEGTITRSDIYKKKLKEFHNIVFNHPFMKSRVFYNQIEAELLNNLKI